MLIHLNSLSLIKICIYHINAYLTYFENLQENNFDLNGTLLHTYNTYSRKKYITYDYVVNSLVLETLRSSNFVVF